MSDGKVTKNIATTIRLISVNVGILSYASAFQHHYYPATLPSFRVPSLPVPCC